MDGCAQNPCGTGIPVCWDNTMQSMSNRRCCERRGNLSNLIQRQRRLPLFCHIYIHIYGLQLRGLYELSICSIMTSIKSSKLGGDRKRGENYYCVDSQRHFHLSRSFSHTSQEVNQTIPTPQKRSRTSSVKIGEAQGCRHESRNVWARRPSVIRDN